MQVDILVQRGQAAGCPDSVGDLQTKVQTIQDSCCVQNGANVCTDGGGPDRCNAACALAFIPYYVQCVEAPTHGVVLPSASAAGDVRVFSLLFSQCTEHLAANETSILLSLVRDRDEEATCSIDTGSILTLSEAKAGPPPCETDVSRMIVSHCDHVRNLHLCRQFLCGLRSATQLRQHLPVSMRRRQWTSPAPGSMPERHESNV